MAISDFNGLHSRKHDDEVELYAFDIWSATATICGRLPLHMRKNNLARLLARRVDGIILRRVRTGRDRAGPVPACLPDGPGRPGLEAPREPYRAGRFDRTGSR